MKLLRILICVMLVGCESSSEDSSSIPESIVPETEEPVVLLPGERADWLRGSWGINWKPSDLYNGKSETLKIDDLLTQIADLRTVDYIQLHLGESYTYSPVHSSPHPILESLWQGDVGEDGKVKNLIVPRAASGIDPFLDMLEATKAAGLKTQVYVNSTNILERYLDDEVNPDTISDITERWKAFCDNSSLVQAFLAEEAHRIDPAFPNREYMFCYTEFVLKDYSIRYGDLVDSWLFDSGRYISEVGDNALSGLAEDQKLFKAFSDSARAGNPYAAISFNNGPERETESLNPFSEPVLYEDYMFGHPYNGGRIIGDHESGLYDRNYAHIEKMTNTNGNVHQDGIWEWDDKVLGHFDPPMSTTSWKGGSTPALTDDEFKLWNLEATRAGGAISWGTPLISASKGLDNLLVQDWGMAQLTIMDKHLQQYQEPGAPNWARAETILPNASFGQLYSHSLVDGFDYWDPESDTVTLSLIDAEGKKPDWLSISADPLNSGSWILSGMPTETSVKEYEFTLRANDALDISDRQVSLTVDDPVSIYPSTGRAQIMAMEDTDYGVNNTATMYSSTLTAPDGLATFQIAFDVIPKSGQNVVSTMGTDATSSKSWGIGSDGIFKGSDDEFVDSVGNLRVVNFNDNGGNSISNNIVDLSFEHAVLADAQSSGDRILIVVDEIENESGGEGVVSNPDKLSLRILGYPGITEFSMGCGNSESNCKWSVNEIEVSYIVVD